MRMYRWKTLATFGVAWALGVLGPARAQDMHTQHRGPHGGLEVNTTRHRFEVLIARSGLRLYAYGAGHTPLDASRLTATVTFYHPASRQPWARRELRPAFGDGGPSPSLDLVADFAAVPTSGFRLGFEVTGLGDSPEPTATFSVPFDLGGAGELAFSQATPADHAAIAAQRVCPVSAKELGSMGTPTKVTRGTRAIFLCCDCPTCTRTIKADPDRYLGASRLH